jgi:hypothetical protein
MMDGDQRLERKTTKVTGGLNSAPLNSHALNSPVSVELRVAQVGEVIHKERPPADAFERIVALFYPVMEGAAVDEAAVARDVAALTEEDVALAAYLGSRLLDGAEKKIDARTKPGSKGRRKLAPIRDRLEAFLVAHLAPRASKPATYAVAEKIASLPEAARPVFDAILAGLSRWKSLRSGAPYYGDRSGDHVVLAEDPSATLTAEQQEGLWRVVRSLDEESAQLVLFILTRCLGAGTPLDGTPQYVDFHVGEALAFRGYAKHHKGGFRAEHKRAERDRVAALARIWMPVRAGVLGAVTDPELKNGRMAKRLRYTPFLTFEIEVDGDVTDGPAALPLFDLPTEATVPYSFSVALGRWANPILLNSTHLRPAFAAIAQYRADRSREERFALRLAMALTFGWNARRYAKQEWATVRELLDDAKIDRPKKHPRTFREDLEHALQRLIEDGIVAGIPGYAWLEDDDRSARQWLDSPIEFAAPPEVVAFFAHEALPLPL